MGSVPRPKFEVRLGMQVNIKLSDIKMNIREEPMEIFEIRNQDEK
jgi:hypothetical protein